MSEVDARLEAELNKIGRQTAKLINRSLLFGPPDELGGLMFREKNKRIGLDEAAAAEQELADLAAANSNLGRTIERVCPERRALINHALACPEERETGEYVDRLDTIYHVMGHALAECIEVAMDAMRPEVETFHSKIGRPRIERAYRVAEQLAEIYVLGLGEMPEYQSIRQHHAPGEHNTAQSDKPTTLFGCVTENVYEILGIPGGTRTPCEQAINNLEGDRFEALMTLRRLRGRRLPLMGRLKRFRMSVSGVDFERE
ncbi:MAG TPA: hypothetical protein VLA52_02570 [Thermohalobaculum sp.]|nr:hypothetical protein [Thermohalobaculum sp.]